MNIIDSHLHLSDLSQNDFSFIDDIFSVDCVDKYLFCTSSHSLSDYNMTCQLIKNIYSKYDISKVKICHSLGIHPQNPDINMTSLLENVLKYSALDTPNIVFSSIDDSAINTTMVFKTTLVLIFFVFFILFVCFILSSIPKIIM